MAGPVLTPTPPQQASVFSTGSFGPRLHHLPPWRGPLHGFSGKGLSWGAGGRCPSLSTLCPSSP